MDEDVEAGDECPVGEVSLSRRRKGGDVPGVRPKVNTVNKL